MITLIAIFVFLLVAGCNWWFGLWSNFLTLVNFLFAALLASSIYEPVAAKLESMLPAYQYLFDFIAVWLVFFLTFGVLRGITDFLSPRQIKFDYWTETIGRSVLSVWIAFVFIQFMLFTFHMAPLAPDDFAKDTNAKVLGFGPDRMWLSLIQSRSRGALSTSKTSSMFGPYQLPTHPDDAELDARVFDPNGQFLFDNHRKRQELANRESLQTGS